MLLPHSSIRSRKKFVRGRRPERVSKVPFSSVVPSKKERCYSRDKFFYVWQRLWPEY